MAGSRNELGRDVDGTINGNNVNSKQVEGVRLTANSRYACGDANWRQNDSPVSSESPTNPPDPCYRVTRPQRKRALTISAIGDEVHRRHSSSLLYSY